MGLAAFNRMRQIESMTPENIRKQNDEVLAEKQVDAPIEEPTTEEVAVPVQEAESESSTETTTTTRRRRRS